MGAGYHLITNKEWMTVARNAEQVASNWTNGVVGGSNVLAAGWRNGSNTGVAPNNTPACLYNTGANTCNATGTVDQRRTLTLSNGNTIWDIGGNVYEWTNDLVNDANNTWASGIAAGWQEWTTFTATQRDSGGPGSTVAYTSTNGVGQVYGGANGNAFLRGGMWGSGAAAGAFTLALYYVPSGSSAYRGFRCAR
jgi:formylglycine-generating enzyme required for sulfatase activity